MNAAQFAFAMILGGLTGVALGMSGVKIPGWVIIATFLPLAFLLLMVGFNAIARPGQ